MTLRVFMLYVAEIGTLFVVKNNRYHHCCMDSLYDGYSPQPDVTEAEMFMFLAITIQMTYCLWDQMTHIWAEMDQFYTAFYSNMMRWNRYSYRNGVDRMEENYNRLWKIHDVSEIRKTEHFLNFTTLSLNLATDEVIVWFTSTVSMCFSDSLCNKFCSPHILSTWKNPTTSSTCNISKHCIVTVLYNTN